MNYFNLKSRFYNYIFLRKISLKQSLFSFSDSVRKVIAFALVLLWTVGLVLGTGIGPSFAGDKKTRIKFSTLAPEGSSWMKEMRRLADEVEQKTDGRVSFKFYPGGVSGDEKDVIRKMRVGQIPPM